MKVYVLLWNAGCGEVEIEGVASSKELAVQWNQDSTRNDFVEFELLETELDYLRWINE